MVGANTAVCFPNALYRIRTGLQPGVTYHYKVADTSGSTDGQAKLAEGRRSGKTHSFTVRGYK
jgi:hypothetical protein